MLSIKATSDHLISGSKTITATGWDKVTQRVFFNSDDYEHGHMLPLRLFKQRYIRAEHAGTTDADKKTVHKDKEA